MKAMRWLVATGLAGAMVAGTALAAGGGGIESASSAPLRGGFGDAADGLRAIDGDRGPFYGLRVNSMNLAAEASNVASFEYAIRGVLPGEGAERYQLVRTIWRGEATAASALDEVLGIALPAGVNVRYPARMTTTRWIRDVGPNGRTPVGGFVGDLAIGVTRADANDPNPVPLFALRVIGTQGLRPMRGDPTDATYSPEDRCAAPLHDEGFYQGGFDRRGLSLVARAAQSAGGDVQHYRTLLNSRIVGTFEGRLELAPYADPRPDRFAHLAKGGWWFDGLLGWKAKRVAIKE